MRMVHCLHCVLEDRFMGWKGSWLALQARLGGSVFIMCGQERLTCSIL